MPNTRTFWKHTTGLALVGACAIGLAIAAPAGAADYDENDQGAVQDDSRVSVSYDAATGDEVVVSAPRYRERGEYGAPIETVAMSRDVRFDDLDLTTDEGVRALQGRIRGTARALCRELEVMHPVAAPNNPPCYDAAVDDAMAQADQAIDAARYAYNDD